MKENIGTRVSKDIAEDIEYLAKEWNVDKSKIVRDLLALAVKKRLMDLALEKYSKREISLGRAAEIARLPLSDFMEEAAERNVAMNYSLESLKGDFEKALKMAKKR
jgi:predicted HTH domain antitoxin